MAILDLSQEEVDQASQELIQSFLDAGQIQHGEIECIGLGLDISEEQSVKDAMNDIVQRWGKIDCLVASAGLWSPPRLNHQEDWSFLPV